MRLIQADVDVKGWAGAMQGVERDLDGGGEVGVWKQD